MWGRRPTELALAENITREVEGTITCLNHALGIATAFGVKSVVGAADVDGDVDKIKWLNACKGGYVRAHAERAFKTEPRDGQIQDACRFCQRAGAARIGEGAEAIRKRSYVGAGAQWRR